MKGSEEHSLIKDLASLKLRIDAARTQAMVANVHRLANDLDELSQDFAIVCEAITGRKFSDEFVYLTQRPKFGKN